MVAYCELTIGHCDRAWVSLSLWITHEKGQGKRAHPKETLGEPMETGGLETTKGLSMRSFVSLAPREKK